MDRVGQDAVEEEQEMQEQEKIVMDLDLPRQAGPQPSDGEVCKTCLPEILIANMNRCTCLKYPISCPSTPKHGNPPTSNLLPQATTARLMQTHSRHTTPP